MTQHLYVENAINLPITFFPTPEHSKSDTMINKADHKNLIVCLGGRFHVDFQGSNDGLPYGFCSARPSAAPKFRGQRICLAEPPPQKCYPCVPHSHLEPALERECERVYDGERENCRKKVGISNSVASGASQSLHSGKRRQDASDILSTTPKSATRVRQRGSWIPNQEGTRIFRAPEVPDQKRHILIAEHDSATQSVFAKDANYNGQIKKPKQYQCQARGCLKAFTTSGRAARHSRSHTDYRVGCPFEACLSTFTRADNCRQHQKIIHGTLESEGC